MADEHLVKELFNTDNGRKVLRSWFLREVGCRKDYTCPTVLAAQSARADFVVEILAQSEVDLTSLGIYKQQEIAYVENPITDDGFFNH